MLSSIKSGCKARRTSMSSNIFENLGALIFCGFLSIFVLPLLCKHFFYFLPQTLHLIIAGKLHRKALRKPSTTSLFWVFIVSFMYTLTYFFDLYVFKLLLTSHISYFCWILFSVFFSFHFVFRFSKIRKEFYQTIYSRFHIKKGRKPYTFPDPF